MTHQMKLRAGPYSDQFCERNLNTVRCVSGKRAVDKNVV